MFIIILLVAALFAVLYFLFQNIGYSQPAAVNSLANAQIPANSNQNQDSGPEIPKSTRTASIDIKNSKFAPSAMIIAQGTSVVWMNSDSVPHQIDVIGFDNGKDVVGPVISKNVKYSLGFLQKGTYNYFCKIHPQMRGKITVQ